MADNETSYPIYNQYAYKDGVGWVMMGASDGNTGATIQINDGTVRNLDTLVINKLTRAEFEALTNPSPDQLYIITDDVTYATVNDLPQPGNTTPQKDGTGNAGSASTYSRSDHVHPAEIPNQSGNNGKFLTTNGSAVSWATVDALPAQSGQNGKYLTTNGSTASWAIVTVPTKTSDLTNDSGYITISDVPAAGEVNQNAYSTIKVDGTNVNANSKTATFTMETGTGIGLTPDTSSRKVTITNTGVTAITEGGTNGTVSVTTNGSTADVAVHGLKGAAYKNASDFVQYTDTPSANTVLAATGANNNPSFRTLVAADIPNITKSKISDFSHSHGNITNAGKITGANAKVVVTSADGTITTSDVNAADLIALENQKIPASYLPSYVDDVVEGYLYNGAFYQEAAHSNVITAETDKIYVDLSTNKTYRYGGSSYVEISASLALGTTSSTAFAGDKGQTAYSHATDANKLTTAQSMGLYKIATTDQGHISSVAAVGVSDLPLAFDETYNASTNKIATVTTVTNKINALDVSNISGFGAGKTLSTLTETNGKISATFQNISITKSQITDFPSTMTPTSHAHTFTITPSRTTIYQMKTVGSVSGGNVGTMASVDVTKFTAGSFSHTSDSFTKASFSTGFYSVGSLKSAVTAIDLTKFTGGTYAHSGFNGGAYSHSGFSGGSYSHSGFSGGSFTRGAFTGGSFTRGAFTGGSYTQGTFTPGALSMTMDSSVSKQVNITFTAPTHASDSFTAATHAADTFVAATHAADAFTAAVYGTDTFTSAVYGTDTFTSATYGTDTFTPASISSGFYTISGIGSVTTLNLSKFNGGAFTEGTFTFTPPSLENGFFTSGTTPTFPTITMPTSSAISVWTQASYTGTTDNN